MIGGEGRSEHVGAFLRENISKIRHEGGSIRAERSANACLFEAPGGAIGRGVVKVA